MLWALLIFFNLTSGLILPNLASKEIINDFQVESAANIITITAYSSTPDQTDSTPFITASGYPVKDGVVASNFLAFNTKIKLPELYGEKIFIVKDRMAKKNSHKIDIWFSTTEEAVIFGVKKTKVEIVES
jgi:3D (Asp-Asp-Asp) domain-containing protein